MKQSKTLLLATGFILALSGASFAQDGQAPTGHKDWKGGHHQCMKGNFTPAQKELLKSTMQQTFKENKPLRDQLHQLRKDMFALSKADKFDQQAFLDKSAEAEKIRVEMDANRDKAFAAVAPQFSPEQRTMLLKMSMHHKHRHGHHGQKDGKWGKKGEGHEWGKMKKDEAPADAAPTDTPAQ